jgi:hypothetical protein
LRRCREGTFACDSPLVLQLHIDLSRPLQSSPIIFNPLQSSPPCISFSLVSRALIEIEQRVPNGCELSANRMRSASQRLHIDHTNSCELSADRLLCSASQRLRIDQATRFARLRSDCKAITQRLQINNTAIAERLQSDNASNDKR